MGAIALEFKRLCRRHLKLGDTAFEFKYYSGCNQMFFVLFWWLWLVRGRRDDRQLSCITLVILASLHNLAALGCHTITSLFRYATEILATVCPLLQA